MGVLGREAILKALDQKEIVIIPENRNFIGPASIDLRVSREFKRVIRRVESVVISDSIESTNLDIYEEKIEVKHGYYLQLIPGDIVIAHTLEKITLGDNLFGWIVGRGRFSKIGLLIEVASGFVRPGTKEEQLYFQIVNMGPNVVHLYPETRLLQLVIERVE